MATTSGPASLSLNAGDYPLSSGQFDEAFAPAGTPRPPYAEVFEALAQHDLAVLRERVLSECAALGLTFGTEELDRVILLGERTGAKRQLEQSRSLGSLPRLVGVLADDFLAAA